MFILVLFLIHLYHLAYVLPKSFIANAFDFIMFYEQY